MTVTYRQEIASSKWYKSGFLKLLWRWRGSIYRLLWADFLAYACLYALVSIIYRVALNEVQRVTFEELVHYCNQFSDAIPMGFALGFYCSIVAGRWWVQYQSIPCPDTLCMDVVSTKFKCEEHEARMMRRNIVRYANLGINMSFVKMSRKVARRFDTLDKFVKEGFLMPQEKKMFNIYREDTKNCKAGPLPDFWIPFLWASSIVTKAREEGKISSGAEANILSNLENLNNKCVDMQSYALINVPLVYTQIITIAVYSYNLTTLIGRQYIGKEIDLYIPFITLMQVLFYLGWLKTAETMLNPFGGDDDDFEILYMIDRNHEMGYVIVDKLQHRRCYPVLSQDIHWDSVFPPNKEVENMSNGGCYDMNISHYSNTSMTMDSEIVDKIPQDIHKDSNRLPSKNKLKGISNGLLEMNLIMNIDEERLNNNEEGTNNNEEGIDVNEEGIHMNEGVDINDELMNINEEMMDINDEVMNEYL